MHACTQQALCVGDMIGYPSAAHIHALGANCSTHIIKQESMTFPSKELFSLRRIERVGRQTWQTIRVCVCVCASINAA